MGDVGGGAVNDLAWYFSAKKLAKLVQEAMRESSVRNAILVEAVQGIEDIKLLRAEFRFQNQWNHMNEVSADISMQQRKIMVTVWTQKIQGLTYAIVVLVGCFAVMAGEMTTGALVACSILSSRMLAPISQVTGILGRFQQAKVAKKSLDELMKKPVDQADHAHLVHKEALHGDDADALVSYTKRWEIETLFSCLKSRGFNLEDSHLTDMKKIKKLLVVYAIAFCWCYSIGEWQHEKVNQIKIKKHGRPMKSVFRLGLDIIPDILKGYFLKQRTTDFIRIISYLKSKPRYGIRHI